MIKIFILSLLVLSCGVFKNSISKESPDTLCVKRGFEVILPYEHAISKIKTKIQKSESTLKNELRSFKKIFENTFVGFNHYKSAGCSTSRLQEYLNCLIETNGKNCKIYYTQMRIVD